MNFDMFKNFDLIFMSLSLNLPKQLKSRITNLDWLLKKCRLTGSSGLNQKSSSRRLSRRSVLHVGCRDVVCGDQVSVDVDVDAGLP